MPFRHNGIFNRNFALSSTRVHPDFLKSILSEKPDLLEQWINFTEHDSSLDCGIRLSSPFYASLCQALFKEGSYEKAVDLYKRLKNKAIAVRVRDQYSHIELIDYSFFQSQPTDFLANEWKNNLLKSKTDKQWLQTATLIWYGEGREWLFSQASESLASQAILTKLRGIMTLGCIPDQRATTIFDSLLDNQPETWLKNYILEIRDFWKRNNWSMHWYKEFFSANDDIQAWTAFRLFLTCVDSRFWHWRSAVESSFSDTSEQFWHRKRFQLNNLDTIKNRIQTNEKSLRDKLLRHKVMQREVWPWM